MEALLELLPQHISEAIGWTLIHSLWQATLIVVFLFALLVLLKRKSAQARYLAAFTALLAIVGTTSITAIKAVNYAKEKQTLVQSIVKNPEQLNKLLENAKFAPGKNTVHRAKLSLFQRLQIKSSLLKRFPLLSLLWIIGVLFFIGKSAISWFYIHKLKKPAYAPELYRKVEALMLCIKEKLDIKPPVKLLIISANCSPMVLGFLKPVIFFPANLITGLRTKEIEAILAHEMAHIKRNDYLFNIIQAVIETLFFFHPVVWVLNRIIREEREQATDELALKTTKDKLNLIKAIAHTQELALSSLSKPALAFSSKQNKVLNRVIKIKNYKTMKKNSKEGLMSALLLFVCFVTLSFTISRENFKRDNDLDVLPSPNITEDTVSVLTQTSRDSIKRKVIAEVDHLESVPKEIEQLLEIAYTEQDAIFTLNILESFGHLMEQCEQDKLMEETFGNVDSVLNEMDINYTINAAIEFARDQITDSTDEALIAKIALCNAQNALKNINIEHIVKESVNHSLKEVENIHKLIVKKQFDHAMRELELNLEEELGKSLGSTNRAIKKIKIEKVQNTPINTEAEIEASLQEIESSMKKVKKALKSVDMQDKEQSDNTKDKIKALEKELKELEKQSR